jgi:hypothetical protein
MPGDLEVGRGREQLPARWPAPTAATGDYAVKAGEKTLCIARTFGGRTPFASQGRSP